MKRSTERDALDKLLAIAASQRSLVTVSQAASVGVTATMLRAAANRGWIGRERRGIYVVGGAEPSRWRPVVAAALAAGSDAAVSHASAAEIHRFYGVCAKEIELTVKSPYRRNLHGVRVHRSTTLQPGDLEYRKGIHLTTPVRTVIDLAGRFGDPLLERILDEGAISRLWTAERVLARLDAVGLDPSSGAGLARGGGSGVSGSGDLRRLLVPRLGEGNPDNKLEQRVVRVLKSVPGYVLHHQEVFDGDVFDMDIAWVAEKIDGEVDGMRIRGVSRTKFERSCRRDNVLQRHGWRIVHFTDKMDDETLVAQVAPLLRS